jgi:hypothetical protein
MVIVWPIEEIVYEPTIPPRFRIRFGSFCSENGYKGPTIAEICYEIETPLTTWSVQVAAILDRKIL